MYGGGVISGPMDLLRTLVELYQLLWISCVRWWGIPGPIVLLCTVVGLCQVPWSLCVGGWSYRRYLVLGGKERGIYRRKNMGSKSENGPWHV